MVVHLPLGRLGGPVHVLSGPGEGAAPRVEGAVVLPSSAETPSGLLQSDSIAMQNLLQVYSSQIWLQCLPEQTVPVSTVRL